MFLHKPFEFQTALGSTLTKAFSFSTSFGYLTKGFEFKSIYYTMLTKSVEYSTEMYDPIINILYGPGALAPTAFGSYIYSGTPSTGLNASGPVPPQVVPDVIIRSFKLQIGQLHSPVILANGDVVQNPNISNASTVDLARYIKTFSMEQNFGGKWSFHATFEQRGDAGTYAESLMTFPSDLNPLFRGKGRYAGALVQHSFDITRQIIITLSVVKNGAYVDWVSPPFAPLAPTFDGYTMSWSGEDLSVIFEQEYQTLKDITPRDIKLSKAWDTMISIGRKYNFINFSFQFPDYTIRKLEMTKSKPIDWLDKIARPYQAFRTWVGQQLQFIAAPNPFSVRAQWVYYSNMVEDPGAEVTLNNDWKNKFTLSRLKDNSGLYGEQTCSGGHCIGRTLKIVLTEPVTNVLMKIDIIGPASMGRFTYFDAHDQVLGISDGYPSFQAGSPIARIEGTFMPTWNQVTAGLTGPFITNTVPYAADYGYSVYVYGGVTSAVGFDSTFTFKLSDPASINVFGIRPLHDSIEDEIIPNAALAKTYIIAVLLQNVRRIFKLTFTTRYINPLVTPPTVIQFQDYLFSLNASNQSNWVVEKVNLDMDEHGHWTQKFECYRGLPID